MVKLENRVEKYAFLRLYDHDLEMAIQTIKVLRRYRRKDVRFPLLRDIVVTYCRPFTESRGDGIRKDFLGVRKFENPEMESLHNKLVNLRSELFAHTDLTFKKPQIANWSKGDKKWFPMAFKGFSYEELDSELPNIINLIKYVQEDLKKQINKYEKSFKS